MYCRKCGKQIFEDSNFCQFCGEAVFPVEGTVIEKTIELTKQEAKNGVEKDVVIDGLQKPLKLMVPPRIQNGQILVLRRIKLIQDGEKMRKDVYLKVVVEDEKKEGTQTKG